MVALVSAQPLPVDRGVICVSPDNDPRLHCHTGNRHRVSDLVDISSAGLPIEVAKTALNILTVAVIAQLASFAVTSAMDHRKSMEARDELRKQTLRRVTSAFAKTNSLRRHLRSQLRHAVRDVSLDNATLRTSEYRSSLSIINDVQLDLELIAKDVETDYSLFKNSKAIFLGISRMEEYLNRLID